MQSLWPDHIGVLDPQGPIGAAERLILLNATSIMLAVVIPVILLTLAFAWWFRARNTRAIHLPDWSYSGPVELVVWSIPALVVMFLGGMGWISSHQLDPPRPIASSTPTLNIQVASLDWKWLFIYPDEGLATVNRLVVPVGTPLHFTLTSNGVMNSFFVPQLGSQIYAMAGMTTHLNLMADKPGTYPGLSAQFSGDGFADMRFDVVVMPVEQYNEWLRTSRAGTSTLDEASYLKLAKPGIVDKPMLYADVAPGMFETIIRKATGH
ncbi:cytochrome o ubiquinol oxidase subunit 2 [Enhydrobacter aerosaccus]|uniref:Ubiquinol oxidase subunit 2 n=1 Tax=Enhydrobacter aerosaccus TaxID=225324 RepID=A0A1T4RX08_9HYPH|nr:ubiquinol oxidase subunit II [Enhydrobacter aerosaccus]SKA20278.1 cytochrome o ubiquinol oxidase subunit 2 [Enhydrobacter aerosaccus]